MNAKVKHLNIQDVPLWKKKCILEISNHGLVTDGCNNQSLGAGNHTVGHAKGDNFSKVRGVLEVNQNWVAIFFGDTFGLQEMVSNQSFKICCETMNKGNSADTISTDNRRPPSSVSLTIYMLKRGNRYS